MNNKELQYLNDLNINIEATEKGLAGINAIIKSKSDEVDNLLDDGCYNLFIGRFDDGSGTSAKLARYKGNNALLAVIKTELEKQLAEQKLEFENI